jgi:outer membrane protein OmpA-like peptidoglycan-associated protein
MKTLIQIIAAAILICTTNGIDGQIKIDLKKKINTQLNNRANQRTDQAINKGLDGVEKGTKDAVKGDKNNDQTQKTQQNQGNNKNQDASSGDGNKSAANTGAGDKSDPQDQTPLVSYSKYDFVPGDKVLLFEDFSQDALGDFPALWTTDVAGEINNLNISQGNWFNLNSGEGNYWFMNDIEFPQNFILEMDIVPKETGGRIAADLVFFSETKHSEMDKNGNPGICGVHIQMEKSNWITKGYKANSTEYLSGSSVINPVEPKKVNHVIIWVQNRRLRIYHKGAKVLDMPTNIYDGCKFKRMCFKLYRGASCGSYISNIKITTAAPDMRSKLLTEGKLVSYGIYFDSNKDIVKAESYGTLKEIAAILNENAELKVKIVGYTDSDGADAANLDLSKKRGAAVKNELAKTFGIDASRLESDGMGETQPVAPNDTPANKALNRRVEFIKL